jgi:hypothetical protein
MRKSPFGTVYDDPPEGTTIGGDGEPIPPGDNDPYPGGG